VQYVTNHSIVLKYVVGFAKLLIFPSVLLPEQSQTKYDVSDSSVIIPPYLHSHP
jgi:hypothetical protein